LRFRRADAEQLRASFDRALETRHGQASHYRKYDDHLGVTIAVGE
jgi:hypothetical protein